jgi:hypothetical protein
VTHLRVEKDFHSANLEREQILQPRGFQQAVPARWRLEVFLEGHTTCKSTQGGPYIPRVKSYRSYNPRAAPYSCRRVIQPAAEALQHRDGLYRLPYSQQCSRQGQQRAGGFFGRNLPRFCCCLYFLGSHQTINLSKSSGCYGSTTRVGVQMSPQHLYVPRLSQTPTLMDSREVSLDNTSPRRSVDQCL